MVDLTPTESKEWRKSLFRHLLGGTQGRCKAEFVAGISPAQPPPATKNMVTLGHFAASKVQKVTVTTKPKPLSS